MFSYARKEQCVNVATLIHFLIGSPKSIPAITQLDSLPISFSAKSLASKVLVVDSLFISLNRTNFKTKTFHYPLQFRVSSNYVMSSYGSVVRCAMKSYRLSELTHTEVENLKSRPCIGFTSIFSTLIPLLTMSTTEVMLQLKIKLDKIVEPVSELPDPKLDDTVKDAFDVAYDNIYAFHLAQKFLEKSVENMKGVKCKRVARSIASVSLYVPGGIAVLPSTALMLAIVS
ncbi:hypothetical protein K2173_000520 [Erythroxylum novogranatense]|uniref:Uncharacterized protein n=1 Tax=Erythroxylum novogranatense TaxID=1862640 RepID=A0AAV8SXP2_9ROSI|nr:hypothetical protein K2173_000520 [Erythroxylum novogranatense]